MLRRSPRRRRRGGGPRRLAGRGRGLGPTRGCRRLLAARGLRARGRLVAASAHPGGEQVAQGFATRVGELVVQACRVDGADLAARLAVEVVELTEPAPRMQVLRVSTSDEETERRLLDLGLDLTEHGGEGFVDAYFTALRSTANRKRHSLIRGRAPRGAILRLRKSFTTPSSPVRDGSGTEGDVIEQQDRLHTRLRVRRSGRFAWHVNPSTRPLADPRRDVPRPRPGEPSAPVDFAGNATTATPCADFDTESASCFNDHPFEVPAGPGIDNGRVTVRIGWPERASDWDLKVFRNSDGDGSSIGETDLVGSSGSAPTTSEETTFAPPADGREYVARVISYAAVSPYEGTVTFAKTESSGIRLRRERWALTCQRRASGKVLVRREVRVARGETARVDLRCACRR